MKTALVLFAIFISASFDTSAAKKPKELVMLGLIAYTGNPPRNGQLCQAAMQFAANAANNQTQILPDYSIRMIYHDESANGVSGGGTINGLYNYKFLSNVTHAAYVAGPYLSPACNPMARLASYADVVSLGYGCADTRLTNDRHDYSNFYRHRSSGEFTNYAMFSFLNQYFRKVGVLTWANNAANYQIAQAFLNSAPSNNISVVFFDAVSTPNDDMMQDLKDSDVRMIVIHTHSPSWLFQVLCFAYRHNIRPPKYAFSIWFPAYTAPVGDPKTLGLPAGCSVDIIAEQYTATFMFGSSNFGLDNTGPTPFGYDLPQFEAAFDLFTNKSRIPDWDMRHRCHDAVVQGALTLDKAEKSLAQSNMTLSDYETMPTAVSNAVNSTAGGITYNSLRIGPFFYDSRLEVDYDQQWIVQWLPQTGLRILGLLKLVNPNWAHLNTDSFQATRVVQPVWVTENGQPPKDFPGNIVKWDTIDASIFWTAVVISIILSIMQIVSLCLQILTKIVRSAFQPKYSPTAAFMTLQTALTAGCILLNLSALTLVLDADATVCYFQRILVSLGLSLFNGPLMGTLLQLRMLVRRVQRFSRMSVAHTAKPLEPGPVDLDFKNQSASIAISAGCLTAINIIVLSIWFGIAPFSVFGSIIAPTQYYANIDAYVTVNVMLCYSLASQIFNVILIVLHVATILSGAAFSLQTRKIYEVVGYPFRGYELRLVRRTTVALSILEIAGVLITFILSTSNATTQNVAAAFSLLVASSFTFATCLIMPWLQRDNAILPTHCSAKMSGQRTPVKSGSQKTSNSGKAVRHSDMIKYIGANNIVTPANGHRKKPPDFKLDSKQIQRGCNGNRIQSG